MANIRKLPSGNYQVRVSIDGVKMSKTLSSLHEATRWAEKFEKINTIESIYKDYLNDVMKVRGVKRGGYSTTESKLIALSRFFKTDIRDITKQDVVSYRVERVTEVSDGTARMEMQILSRLLRWAKERELVDCDITNGVQLPRPGKPRDKIITPLEFDMILSRTTDVMKPIFILGYETAMRRNEILSIKPNMVNITKRILLLNESITKNGDSREVPLSSIATSLLKELCEGRDSKVQLFTVKPHSVTRAFKRACIKAGIFNVCFHSLRHTCITRYAEKNLNIIQLQGISGHKDVTSLSRYSHLKAEKIVKFLD